MVYRRETGRLDLCSSPIFFEKDKKSTILIDEFEINKLQSARPVPLIQGVLEVYDGVLNTRPFPPPAFFFDAKNLWKVFAFVLGAYMLFIGVLYGLSQLGQAKEKKASEQQIVKIIKPPSVVQPEKSCHSKQTNAYPKTQQLR